MGALAEPLAREYSVGLGIVGLFTTSLFLVHSLVQIPGGRMADRFGPYPVALAALVLIAAGNAFALAASDAALGISARALAGLGTGAAFVAGSDYVRTAGGGALAQGVFGGATMGGGGLALAVVPALHGMLDWRAPFFSACAVALAALGAFAVAPRAPRTRLHESRDELGGLSRDRGLRRLAVVHMASLGLNAVVANWSVTLLVRGGGLSLAAAGLVSALTLVAGVVGRPLGGWVIHRSPQRGRAVVVASLLAGGAGTALLVSARPPALALVAATVVGLGAGLAFAPVFGAAAAARPQSPGAAVGLVNMAGNLVIVVGTPLLGLAFDLPGEGRIGFAAVAVLWFAALLALPSSAELRGRVTVTPAQGRPLRQQAN